jgi:calcineurin-like phosphoesterase family protein
MTQVWHTSDLHIGHRLVAVTRYEVKGKRIWTNGMEIPEWFGDYEIARHDEILADRWDSRVGKDDLVYVQGDICSGTGKAYLNALNWIDHRPGRKILIHGNHDPISGMHRDAPQWAERTMQTFYSHHAYLRRRVPLPEGGHQDILLSHFPYEDADVGIGSEGRYAEYRLTNRGTPVVHGHTHSRSRVSYANYRGGQTLQLHVGVDAWGGAPVPLSWIVSEVQAWVGRTDTPEA